MSQVDFDPCLEGRMVVKVLPDKWQESFIMVFDDGNYSYLRGEHYYDEAAVGDYYPIQWHRFTDGDREAFQECLQNCSS